MPIVKTAKGNLLDLFDSGVFDAIAHGANCFHTMGSGIAGQIAQRYPGAVQADIQHHSRGDEYSLGKYSTFENNGRFIFNLYTQYRPGRENPDRLYRNIGIAFQTLNNDSMPKVHLRILDVENPVVGIPMIGSGIARGDWDRISGIINRVTPDIDIIVIEFAP